MSDQKEMESYSLHTKKLTVEAVQKIFEDAEKEEGISINYQVKSGEEERFIPGLTAILITIGKEFAGFILDKYGDNVKDWLKKKIGVNEEEGETVEEVDKN